MHTVLHPAFNGMHTIFPGCRVRNRDKIPVFRMSLDTVMHKMHIDFWNKNPGTFRYNGTKKKTVARQRHRTELTTDHHLQT